MTASLNLTNASAVFACPACRETINTSLDACPFCNSVIDQTIAEASALETTRISQACSDASYLKVMLGILATFCALIFFPFLGLAGLVGFVFVKYAIPVLVIRWWIKYGRIQSPDPDLRKARHAVITVSVVWLVALVAFHVNLFGLRL